MRCIGKIYYEKVYARVNLDFLYEVLELRGFGPVWINMIKQVTPNGFIGVRVNEAEGDFFPQW